MLAPRICTAARQAAVCGSRRAPPAGGEPASPSAVQRRTELDEATSEYDKEKLKERIAKLAGGMDVVKVSTATEIAMKQKKDRIDNAQHTKRGGSRGRRRGIGARTATAVGNRQRYWQESRGNPGIGQGPHRQLWLQRVDRRVWRHDGNGGPRPDQSRAHRIA
jgi:hypothetical protein